MLYSFLVPFAKPYVRCENFLGWIQSHLIDIMLIAVLIISAACILLWDEILFDVRLFMRRRIINTAVTKER